MNTFLPLFVKLVKFCVVGFTGMIIDFSTTWLLKEKCAVNKYIANSSGFLLAAINNYVWNRWWTFESNSEEVMSQFLLFVGISVIGLGLNNMFIYLFNDKLRWNFYFSKVIAIGLVTVWNFFMNLFFTFD